MLGAGDQLRKISQINARWQAAAHHQQRTGFNGQHFFLKLPKLVLRQVRAGHHKAVLFAAGFNVYVQILACPVMRRDGVNADVFFFKQSGEMLAGSAASGEQRRGVPA